MSSAAKWGDLAPRVLSGVLMAGAGMLAVWAGGWAFLLLVAALCGLIAWELARMTNPAQPGAAVQIGLMAALAIVLAGILPAAFTLPITLAPALAGAGILRRNNGLFAMFAAWVLLAGLGFVLLREQGGMLWLLWLVLVVVASDMAGYFCGKALGGPKFWPRISPSKTWSGTFAGWLAAALVGVVFALVAGAGWHIVGVSVIVALAAQAGDIAESALKRRMGVKDSSALIPGHGGVFDRFDGMVGAAALLLILMGLGLLHLAEF